jgi:hypothetical protein
MSILATSGDRSFEPLYPSVGCRIIVARKVNNTTVAGNVAAIDGGGGVGIGSDCEPITGVFLAFGWCG